MSPIPTRRPGLRLPAVLLALALAVVLSGCGAANTKADDTPAGDGKGGFPLTIEHKYGKSTIESEPKRVVTLGLSDQDTALALGVKPVGVVDWFKERPYGKWEWSKQAWGSTKPAIVGERDEYNQEKIAELAPDVIIAQYSGMKQEQYETLSKIAPVVAQPKGHEDYQAPWQDMTRVIGKALGKDAETEKLISDIDQRFAKVREEHADWKGKTVAVGEPYEPGKFSAFSPKDPKVIFLTEMGFTTTKGYQDALGKQNVGDFSFERFDVMEADRTVWLGPAEAEDLMKADKLYQKTKVRSEDRDLFLPYEQPDIGAALSFNTVLSIPYAIDEVVPKLEAIDD